MINIKVIKPDNKLGIRYFKTAEHRINNEWKYYFFKNENNILEKIFDFIRDKWTKTKEHEYSNLIIFYSNLNDMKPQDLINFFYKRPNIFHPSFIIVKKKNEIFKPQNFENYNSIIRIIKEDNFNELVIYLNEITYFYNFLGDEIIFPINFMKESIFEQNIQLITKHLFTFNILILGKPCSGRRTLINKILGKKKLYSHSFEVPNKNVIKFIHEQFPISFYFPSDFNKYDYSSFELEKKIKENYNELKIENNRIHCIFYLLDAISERTFIQEKFTFIKNALKLDIDFFF